MMTASKVDPDVLHETRLLTPEEEQRLWERAVLDLAQHACSNCGGVDKLKVHMLVPVAAGGTVALTNGFVLCRTCEMASDASKSREGDEKRRPLNFWVSRGLYDSLQRAVEEGLAFGSMGALVRYLMARYVTDETRYDDLPLYVEHGADVKVNVWVDADIYATFKALVNKKNLTVTDAVKALVRVFQESVSVLKEEK